MNEIRNCFLAELWNLENILITSQGMRLVKTQADNEPNSGNLLVFTGFYKKGVALERSNNSGIQETHERILSAQNIMWDQHHKSLCKISSNVQLTKWGPRKIFFTLFYALISAYQCFRLSVNKNLKTIVKNF